MELKYYLFTFYKRFLKMQTPVYGQQVTAINQQPTAIAQAHIQHPAAYQQQRNRPLNRWGDSICDWLTNLYPSCYCACCVCHGMYIVSQSKYHTYISYSILKMNYINHIIIIIIIFILCIILLISVTENGFRKF